MPSISLEITLIYVFISANQPNVQWIKNEGKRHLKLVVNGHEFHKYGPNRKLVYYECRCRSSLG